MTMQNVTKHNASSMTNVSKNVSAVTNVSKSLQKYYLLIGGGGYLLTAGTAKLIIGQSTTGMNVTNITKHNG